MGWPVAEHAAATKIEDDRRWDDRNHVIRLWTNWPPNSSCLQPVHDAVGCHQSVRAPTGEDDRIDPVDQRRRVQQVRLPGARAAATYVDPTDRTPARQHHCRPRQPALAVRGVVADLKALDHPLILPICRG